MRNISVFCLWRVALYFKPMPNSIDFYKGIFLYVIHVHEAILGSHFLLVLLLKTQGQISKKSYVEKYCSCYKAYYKVNFQLYRVYPARVT